MFDSEMESSHEEDLRNEYVILLFFLGRRNLVRDMVMDFRLGRVVVLFVRLDLISELSLCHRLSRGQEQLETSTRGSVSKESPDYPGE